jgi:hypothetical protein
MIKLNLVGLILALGITSACGDTIVNNLPPTPVDTTTKVTLTNIEFRVTGNANSVRVRYTNSLDGTVQTVTSLPFFNSFNTDKTAMFLSITVTPLQSAALILDPNPFLTAQIFVNDVIFREASSIDYSTNLVVSGDWRK